MGHIRTRNEALLDTQGPNPHSVPNPAIKYQSVHQPWLAHPPAKNIPSKRSHFDPTSVLSPAPAFPQRRPTLLPHHRPWGGTGRWYWAGGSPRLLFTRLSDSSNLRSSSLSPGAFILPGPSLLPRLKRGNFRKVMENGIKGSPQSIHETRVQGTGWSKGPRPPFTRSEADCA